MVVLQSMNDNRMSDDEILYEEFKMFAKSQYENISKQNNGLIVVDSRVSVACSEEDYENYNSYLAELADNFVVYALAFDIVDPALCTKTWNPNFQKELLKHIKIVHRTAWKKEGKWFFSKQAPSIYTMEYLIVSSTLHKLFRTVSIEAVCNNLSSQPGFILGKFIHSLATGCKLDQEFKKSVLDKVCFDKNNNVGQVYFLVFLKSEQLKIGFTTNLKQRLAAYATHSAEKFIVYKTIDGSKMKEKEIHSKLKKFKVKTEFFSWSTQVQAIVDALE